ncbi:hypothetical protein BSN85_21480 [Bradyrhizobium brasilense]|nr:hypothetical protein BSN85_21480 [Bradyrhizobium brasilense]
MTSTLNGTPSLLAAHRHHPAADMLPPHPDHVTAWLADLPEQLIGQPGPCADGMTLLELLALGRLP